MSKKDNVIMFPTKAKVPDTITISFGDSEPVTYILKEDGNIDLSGLDDIGTITLTERLESYDPLVYGYETMSGINLSFGEPTSVITITDVVDYNLLNFNEKQLSLNFDEEN